jgi:hypothetical protein
VTKLLRVRGQGGVEPVNDFLAGGGVRRVLNSGHPMFI